MHDYSDETVPVSSDILQEISAKAEELAAMMRREESLKEELDSAQKKVRACREFDLPSLMEKAGLSHFKTKSGFEVNLKEKIRVGQIDNTSKPDAIKWVEDEGEADLIKTELTVNFSRGERQVAIQWLEEMQSRGLKTINLKETIHAQTTAAFLKRKLEAGENIPLALFGAFIQRYADVKM